MLYVFHVDTGRMIKFDMNVALSSVQNLKDTIERLYGYPASNIVLLVSGGEMLTPGSLVCSYSAGTDTNPIYMFSTIDIKPQPWPSIEPDVDLTEQVDRCLALPATYSTVVARAQLAQQIYDLAHEEESICERLVYEQHLQQQGWSAVIANMEDLTEEFRQRFENFCKCFEEHLKKRNNYLELLGQFSDDLDKLARIPILPGLMKNAEEEFHGFDEYLNNDEAFSRSHQQNVSVIAATQSTQSSSHKISSSSSQSSKEVITSNDDENRNTGLELAKTSSKECCIPENSGSGGSDLTKIRTLTLLQWITAKENHNTLKIMAEECIQGLTTFDEDKFEKLKQDVMKIIKTAEQDEIKEIKGLEDRLYGLEKLKCELKKLVQEQKELSTAFQQNQSRASNLGDASILPDLCASHRSQLVVMLQNQKIIRDIRRRISRAKDELGANLDKRLKYIVHIENTMSELDNNLLFYHRCLRRVERHLNIIQQIHQTPNIYVSAVTEVVRRRIFSREFVNWASTLACDFYTIHNDEVLRRQEFNTNFEGHFLNALFPGMNDMPPAFANETPFIFDAGLPNITKSDLDVLTSYLPDIISKIQFPDMGPVIEFFVSRSGSKIGESKNSTTSKSQSNNTLPPAIGHRPIDLHSHLKDGFESETDTEEFEKVGQSSNEPQSQTIVTVTIATSTSENIPQTVTKSTSMEVVAMQSVETLTEDNLGSTRLEVENLKCLLKNMSQISSESLVYLRNDLKNLKKDTNDKKDYIKSVIEEFSNIWHRLKNEYETREKDIAENLKFINQIDIEKDMKINELNLLCNDKTAQLASQKEIIENLEKERDTLRDEIKKMNEKISNLQDIINTADLDKEKALTECRERLIHEHKNEIESLRCRFKLMTSMERSPSDTSLEKIEKPDMIEIACHESILHQAREDMNNEKELAIKAAVELERSKWTSGHGAAAGTTETVGDNSDNSQKTCSNTMMNKMELLKKIIEEKDKQLDAFRERDVIRSEENFQLKIKIEALTMGEESDKQWLKERLETLNKEKLRLEQELNMEKSRRQEMESSFATVKGISTALSRDVLGSPDLGGARSKMTNSQLISSNLNITTESCVRGDIVFVVWNVKHGQYTVVQDSTSLYFVHGDSLGALNLKLPSPGEIDMPFPLHCIGKVIDKEYCQARKDENRYKVTKGTRFYRIKLQPIIKMESSRLHHKRERYESSSSSTSVSRSTSTQHLIDSFAQTESSVTHSAVQHDIVDSAVTVPTAIISSISATSSTTSTASLFKERTMSVCSVAEEEDEPISLLSERCHYTSLSEEEEKVIGTDAWCSDADFTTLNPITVTSVSSSTSPTTLITSSTTNQQQQTMNTATSTANTSITTITATTSTTESSSEKDQDDSDEYRSLEAKDESDFPTTV